MLPFPCAYWGWEPWSPPTTLPSPTWYGDLFDVAGTLLWVTWQGRAYPHRDLPRRLCWLVRPQRTFGTGSFGGVEYCYFCSASRAFVQVPFFSLIPGFLGICQHCRTVLNERLVPLDPFIQSCTGSLERDHQGVLCPLTKPPALWLPTEPSAPPQYYVQEILILPGTLPDVHDPPSPPSPLLTERIRDWFLERFPEIKQYARERVVPRIVW